MVDKLCSVELSANSLECCVAKKLKIPVRILPVTLLAGYCKHFTQSNAHNPHTCSDLVNENIIFGYLTAKQTFKFNTRPWIQ